VLAPVPRRVHHAVAPGEQLVPALPVRAAYRRPGVRDLESRADRGCLNQLRGWGKALLVWFYRVVWFGFESAAPITRLLLSCMKEKV